MDVGVDSPWACGSEIAGQSRMELALGKVAAERREDSGLIGPHLISFSALTSRCGFTWHSALLPSDPVASNAIASTVIQGVAQYNTYSDFRYDSRLAGSSEIGTNWFDVIGAATTNAVTVPVDLPLMV